MTSFKQKTNMHDANRRDVVKAAVAGGAIAASASRGGWSLSSTSVLAQEIDGTRGRNWIESENIDTSIKLEGDGWVTLRTEFPFWALGFGWDEAVGTWPAVQYGFSYDGEIWDDGYSVIAHSDGGPAATDARHHTPLHFTDGQQYIRYRTIDGEANLVILDRFQVTYIDPTDGPWEPDRGRTLMRTSAEDTDTRIPPSIISRAQWGANENLRFDKNGEIWPPEYETVEHAIVHHAAVNYGSDGYNAVRSIYYYHTVTQGWGDIGYNYVVDVRGNIFEGRVGGANAIGGHAYQYAIGSSGICIMGDFTTADPPLASKVALANIIAYVARDLDPNGRKTFHQVPNLPTIAAHRDVNQSTCPGNGLYDDMSWIRSTVANILDTGALESHMPGGIVPGDWVKVQTDDESDLQMRAQPGVTQLVVDSIPHDTRIEVERGPLTDSDHNWYLVNFNSRQGWVPADYLVVDPPTIDEMEGYEFGRNIQLTGTIAIKASPSTIASTVATETSTWAFLLAGPYPAGNTQWFQIRTQNGREGWVTKNQFSLATRTTPTPVFALGKEVQTVRSTSIRVRPGISQTTMSTVDKGARLTISVEPVSVTGRTWYGVFGGTGTGGGWIDAADIEVAPEPVTAIGQRFRVTEGMNFRSGAGTGYGVVGTLAAGTMGTIIGGPVSNGGYRWWQLRTNSGSQGWAVSNWLVAIGGGSTPPSDPPPTDPPPPTGGKFAIGDTARVTEGLNMRSGAGTGFGVVALLPAASIGTVLDGPRNANGYTWWLIQTSRGTGWVVENWVVKQGGSTTPTPEPTPDPTSTPEPTQTPSPEPTSTPDPTQTPTPDPTPIPPPTTGGKFEIGDTVRATEGLNMRSGASTGNGVVAVLPAGTTGTVLDGPRTANGYTWWRIQTSRGTGWVVENWVAMQSGSTPTDPPPATGDRFAIGDTARVTEGLNIRSGAGTAYGVVAVLPAGTIGTVLDGPRTANSYTWWQIRTNRGTGWAVQNWLVK